jgi:hypothetical protein
VNPWFLPALSGGKTWWRSGFKAVISFRHILRCLGVFMRVYYQVVAGFRFSGSKLLLVSLSLHSTKEYFPWLVGSASSPLSQSRFFHTVTQANNYIEYLYRVYPSCAVPRPVAYLRYEDSKQLLLF